MTTAAPTTSSHSDLLVVGAGIVGLAHAVEAAARGLRVTVLDRDERAVGASIRNFGHICLTAQTGRALAYGLAGRQRWIDLAAKSGFWLRESGSVVVARAEDEAAVLTEFAETRDAEQVRLLDRAGVAARLPLLDPATTGGAWLPLDLRVDPRQAVPAITAWLAGEGVGFHWGANVLRAAAGEVITSRGPVHRRPGAHRGRPRGRPAGSPRPPPRSRCAAACCRCSRSRRTIRRRSSPRCSAACPCCATPDSPAARPRPSSATGSPARIRSCSTLAVNLMFTQRPDGALVIGDTHDYARTHEPFDDEATADVIIREAGRLLGTDRFAVRRRWRGVYASSEQTDFLITDLDPITRLVSVTSGIGMTTAFGLAVDVLDSFLDDRAPREVPLQGEPS